MPLNFVLEKYQWVSDFLDPAWSDPWQGGGVSEAHRAINKQRTFPVEIWASFHAPRHYLRLLM
jgi:hypothetical protein